MIAFDTTHAICGLAELGEGVALGWARSVQDRLDAGSLVRVPNLSIPLPDYINVYRNRQAPTKPSSRAFVELLKSQIRPIGSSVAQEFE